MGPAVLSANGHRKGWGRSAPAQGETRRLQVPKPEPPEPSQRVRLRFLRLRLYLEARRQRRGRPYARFSSSVAAFTRGDAGAAESPMTSASTSNARPAYARAASTASGNPASRANVALFLDPFGRPAPLRRPPCPFASAMNRPLDSLIVYSESQEPAATASPEGGSGQFSATVAEPRPHAVSEEPPPSNSFPQPRLPLCTGKPQSPKDRGSELLRGRESGDLTARATPGRLTLPPVRNAGNVITIMRFRGVRNPPKRC